ncbi:MAG TPA: hypothetical protein VIV11_29430, partial [Kofleriaceae bacterium]
MVAGVGCGISDDLSTSSTSNALTGSTGLETGIEENGLATNELVFNGVWDNGVWDNGVWDNNLTARALLRPDSDTYNPHTGKVLQYIYECAMPATRSTRLDLGDGYELVLTGKIGLAPQWFDGACDQSCQRWVSACVLARTNAYGVKVPISMRVSDSAPQHIKDALALAQGDAETPGEAELFPVREGTYYGNLFQRTGPLPDTSGPTINTPTFYACAGPGSNIPEITKRFCSSQGNNGPIKVTGTCDAVCGGVAVEGAAVASCPPVVASEEPFTEVITVYVKDLIAVCGNAVCEVTEAADASCPSDCHPDTWARSFEGIIMSAVAPEDSGPPFPPIPTADNPTSPLEGPEWSRVVAVTPDDSIVLAGVTAVAANLDLGGSLGSVPALQQAYSVLAKYDSAGEFVWAKLLSIRPRTLDIPIMNAGSVAVGPDSSIVFAATGGADGASMIVGKLDESLMADQPVPIQWWLISEGVRSPTKALAIDSQGNVIIGGSYRGAGTMRVEHPIFNGLLWDVLYAGTEPGDVQFPDSLGTSTEDAFVLKVSAAGIPQWLLRFGDVRNDAATGVTVDADDNVIVTLFGQSSPAGIVKLSPAGDTLWSKRGNHTSATVDRSGNVFATGRLEPKVHLKGTPRPFYLLDYDFSIVGAIDNDFFVAKYAPDGAPLGAKSATRACPPPSTCGGEFTGLDISLVRDPVATNDAIVVGVRGGLLNS